MSTPPNTRYARITNGLMYARKNGAVSDWIVSSPAGRTRWNVWGPGWERTFNTREIEAFLVGVYSGSETAVLLTERIDREEVET
jgi:hypothetical protein